MSLQIDKYWIGFGLAVFYCCYRYVSYLLVCRDMRQRGIPIRTYWIDELSLLGFAVPQKLFGVLELKSPDMFYRKHNEAAELGGLWATVCVFGNQCKLLVNSSEVVKDLVSRRSEFPKPLHLYKVLDIFGPNVVTTEAEEWRFHRKITSRPFSEANNRLVHSESIIQTRGMMDEIDNGSSDGLTRVPSVVSLTMKLALHVILSAGFGVPTGWQSVDSLENGHKMSFRNGIDLLLHNLLPIIIFPKWILNIPVPRLRIARDSYAEVDRYMQELVDEERRQLLHSERSNLMAAMLNNSREDSHEKSLQVLSNQEVIGNSFIFLLAGHETTSGALTYALTMLALTPVVQSELLSDIVRVCGDREPTYEQLNDLVLSLAVMNETLRMFPPVILIPKWTAAKPQTLANFLIPAAMEINIDVVAAHYNPKVFGDDADSFNPSRWLDAGSIRTFAKGSFLAFSEGSRSCLGKRFAQVEFLTVLSTLIMHYEVSLPADYPANRVWQILDGSHSIITLQPKQAIPLVFTKRV